ncbi:Ubiquitin carboxyl-terminal hydrolase 22, partial [Bonamia ostreae]
TVTTPAKIERIPKILCLHLSRGLQNAKNNKFVKFDAIISDDYYPFLYDFKFKYVLSAVIEHRGFLFEGHYIAYVKNNNNWYKCSDSKIEYSNIDEVLRTQAYILFYEYESH